MKPEPLIPSVQGHLQERRRAVAGRPVEADSAAAAVRRDRPGDDVEGAHRRRRRPVIDASRRRRLGARPQAADRPRRGEAAARRASSPGCTSCCRARTTGRSCSRCCSRSSTAPTARRAPRPARSSRRAARTRSTGRPTGAEILRRLIARYGTGGARSVGAGSTARSSSTGRRSRGWPSWPTAARSAGAAPDVPDRRRQRPDRARAPQAVQPGAGHRARTSAHATARCCSSRSGSTTGMIAGRRQGQRRVHRRGDDREDGLTVETPWDMEGADILLIHNAGEILAWPENPGAFARHPRTRPASRGRCRPSMVGYDSVNYGLWYDDAQFARVALKHAEVAKKLR